jgi:hypothetical protein
LDRTDTEETLEGFHQSAKRRRPGDKKKNLEEDEPRGCDITYIDEDIIMGKPKPPPAPVEEPEIN